LILNKFFLHIAFLICLIPAFGQSNLKDDQKKSTWKKEKDYLKYKKQRDYKGPEDWYNSEPSDIKTERESGDYYGSPYSPSGQGVQYSPQRIKQDRERQFGSYDRGGGNGDLDFDPEVKKPDPVEFPKYDPPEVDPPNGPDIDPPMIPAGLGKVLLFLLLFIAIILIVYFWLKNRKPQDQRITVDVENNWNPEVITKTELELRLEEAMKNEDYRECIRIYFTFILKELIRKNFIRWKTDKTNYHYLMEMSGKPGLYDFRECVRIYDLVWYGEYQIDKEIFEMLQPSFKRYYETLVKE